MGTYSPSLTVYDLPTPLFFKNIAMYIRSHHLPSLFRMTPKFLDPMSVITSSPVFDCCQTHLRWWVTTQVQLQGTLVKWLWLKQDTGFLLSCASWSWYVGYAPGSYLRLNSCIVALASTDCCSNLYGCWSLTSCLHVSQQWVWKR